MGREPAGGQGRHRQGHAGPALAALSAPLPAAPPRAAEAHRASSLPPGFGVAERPLTRDGLNVDPEGWRIDARQARTVRLFEVPTTGLAPGVITYRAQLKSDDVSGAYLEMWCRFPGRGEFFSRSLNQRVSGATDWASVETPFLLRQGEEPDLIKLNLVIEGGQGASVWIRNVELLVTPLR